MFDCKSLRATSFEIAQYLGKIGLSFSKTVCDEIKEAIIEPMISKKYSCTSAEYIFFVANEHIASWS